MNSKSKHWDGVFLNHSDSKLGWYEKEASQTFKLLDLIPNYKNSTFFLPGAGTSVLIDALLSIGAKLVLNDISNVALDRVKLRLDEIQKDIIWLHQDIAAPIADLIEKVDIWIDRAVLHFLTDKDDICGYFENVKSALKIGGYIIFAEFTHSGTKKCAGLPIHQYSLDDLSNNLGPAFTLKSHFDFTYHTPCGSTRPYIYALYKREY